MNILSVFWCGDGCMFFRWPVYIQLRNVVFEAQFGAGVGVAWPFPSGLASGHIK